ncbi:hypothetical protein FD754_017638 [Muntiacus muntjak]|uniref:Clavesin-2 n=1 Tax=Muntiacus muntjak TaxID=9888 RepID=A0A5N3VU50_MUNMU|nr:hypothetical protein FD754_017638 [Muntiacus muntjak]
MTHLQAGLSPETLEKARLELNENPDTLHQDIQEVRDMVITRPDIGFLRTDDAFILRFLRARKFHHFEAFRLLAQYFEYRQQNLDMFKSFKATDPGIKQALKDGFPGGLANLDHYGRKILVLFAANWDQSRYTLVDILRAILLSLEAMIEDPELQVNGFVLIIDWSNFTFKQASKLTPSMLRLAIEGLQDVLLLSAVCYFIYNIYGIKFKFLKRFGNTWKCGYQLESVLILPYCQQHVKWTSTELPCLSPITLPIPFPCSRDPDCVSRLDSSWLLIGKPLKRGELLLGINLACYYF